MEIIINNNKIKLVYAKKFYNRLMGLMFKKSFDYGIFFPKCHSIHTFFMKEDIDVIMINKDNKIVYLKRNVKKNNIITKKEAYHTIELPANTLNNLAINDYVEINL